MAKLNEMLANMEPDKKQKVIKFSIIGLVVVIVLGWYVLSGEGEKRAEEQLAVAEAQEQEEALDNFDLMSEDISETFNNQFEQQNSVIDSAASSAQESLQTSRSNQNQIGEILNLLKKEKAAIPVAQNDNAYFEVPNAQPQGYQPPPSFRSEDNLALEQTSKIIGTIGRVQGVRQVAEKKSQPNEKYFLPMSFAKAQTLHGLRIVTSEGAMADPEQLLIRIQAPSVLPNSIKANLEGCFLMSSVTAHLSKRRIEPQLVRMSCLDKDGKSVIEEDVQGYVVDSDGNKGMSANIVSQMSDFILRAILTGTIGGIGEGVSLSGVQNSITGAGTVQTFDTDRITQSGLGKGVKNGADAVQDIFVDLAKQHAPVAETGATKNIFVVFQKGVWLNIKPRYSVSETGSE